MRKALDEKERRIIEELSATNRLLTDLTSAGSWTINFAPDGSVASVQWGDGFRRLLGYRDRNDFPDDLEPFLQGIHPEDKDAFVADLSSNIFDDIVLNTTGNDFRFRRKDGTVRWYRSRGKLTRDDEGRPLQYRGVTIDITREKEHDTLYRELQNEAASLDTIHEMLGSGKWTMDFDENGEMASVNWSDEFRRMLGYNDTTDFPDVLESWSDLLHPDDKERILREFNETISDYTGQRTYDVEYRLLTKNRGYRWYRAIGKPTRRSDGSPITYIGVFIDITGQKEMMRELAQQRESLSIALEEANQANKAKTAFLSDMSRIESGRLTMRNEAFSFATTLEQVNTIISGQCSEKGIDYECVVKGAVDDYYIGDGMKLRQVMINILGNAVKFTPEGGSIRFVAEAIARLNGRTTLRFTISDTGIGMSKEFLPKLFDAFSQEDTSITSPFGSTGLGMSITRNLIELMNGTISVDSEKGKGTTFIVTVTLTDSDRKSAAETDDAMLVREKADLKGRRVLLAEDVPVNAEIMMMVLSMREIEADHAENGRLAVEMFAGHDEGYYDAILMDMRMPEMDGLEATRRIRAMDRPDAKSIPIIALTANAFDEDVQLSMQAGLNTHLSKPVEPEVLFETIEGLLTQ